MHGTNDEIKRIFFNIGLLAFFQMLLHAQFHTKADADPVFVFFL